MVNVRFTRVTRENSIGLSELAHEFARAAGEPSEFENPETYFDRVDRFSRSVRLPPDRVAQQEFWLLAGDRILGNSRLRLELIPKLELDGGNISYDVRPSERGNNVPSIRVILGNGGREIDKTISPFTGETLRRFEIRL